MPIRHEDIKDDRQWRAATGVTREQFADLTARFGRAYEDRFGKTIAERQGGSSQKPTFTTYAEQLFFLLYSLKSGLTLDLLALSFACARSTVVALQADTQATFQRALVAGGYHPKRAYNSPAEFLADWQAEAPSVVLLDATEHRRQRPGDRDAQKSTYSGKKKAHTTKLTIAATLDRRIKYVSVPYEGRVHDFTLLKAAFPPEAGRWFGGMEVHMDLGYLGFEGKYPGAAAVSIPAKRPRGGELSDEDKASNKAKSKVRVKVEHAIGGMKRFRVLSDRLRRQDMKAYSAIVGITAGLWNYNVSTSKC